MRPAHRTAEVVEAAAAKTTPADATLEPTDPNLSGQCPVATPARGAVTADVATENAAWIRGLSSPDVLGDETRRQLFDFLVRAASIEARWRSPYLVLNGPELDDLAHQAAADAMITLVRKMDTFRGDCRFTTWAYRFAALTVGSKIRRHPWHKRHLPFHVEDWLDSPASRGDEPEVDFEAREMRALIGRVVAAELTSHQREVLIASIVDETPADDLAERLGSNRNAIYKVLFDARQKIRLALRAEGFTPPPRR
jgi:RNA polymerase sigma factor (sigma-70 family)